MATKKTETSGGFSADEMAAFDREVQRYGRFPSDTVFDPGAEARGEPRWRKASGDDEQDRGVDLGPEQDAE